jgi:hypothetical protein
MRSPFCVSSRWGSSAHRVSVIGLPVFLYELQLLRGWVLAPVRTPASAGAPLIICSNLLHVYTHILQKHCPLRRTAWRRIRLPTRLPAESGCRAAHRSLHDHVHDRSELARSATAACERSTCRRRRSSPSRRVNPVHRHDLNQLMDHEGPCYSSLSRRYFTLDVCEFLRVRNRMHGPNIPGLHFNSEHEKDARTCANNQGRLAIDFCQLKTEVLW